MLVLPLFLLIFFFNVCAACVVVIVVFTCDLYAKLITWGEPAQNRDMKTFLKQSISVKQIGQRNLHSSFEWIDEVWEICALIYSY